MFNIYAPPLHFVITDVVGKELASGHMGNLNSKIDIKNLPPGIHMISIFNDEIKLETIKFIKQ